MVTFPPPAAGAISCLTHDCLLSLLPARRHLTQFPLPGRPVGPGTQAEAARGCFSRSPSPALVIPSLLLMTGVGVGVSGSRGMRGLCWGLQERSLCSGERAGEPQKSCFLPRTESCKEMRVVHQPSWTVRGQTGQINTVKLHPHRTPCSPEGPGLPQPQPPSPPPESGSAPSAASAPARWRSGGGQRRGRREVATVSCPFSLEPRPLATWTPAASPPSNPPALDLPDVKPMAAQNEEASPSLPHSCMCSCVQVQPVDRRRSGSGTLGHLLRDKPPCRTFCLSLPLAWMTDYEESQTGQHPQGCGARR